MTLRICPDKQLIVIARDDDTAFGILHSRFHEIWSLRLGTSLEDRPRYTPTTTFETFPFPDGLTPDIPAADYAADPRAVAIADAAQRLVERRDRWLNPPEWVEWVDEPVPGYPTRPVPRDEAAAKALKKRTLTNLYNARPQWFATHRPGRRPARAAVCRIPCLILCLADVERTSMAWRTVLTSRQRSALVSLPQREAGLACCATTP